MSEHINWPVKTRELVKWVCDSRQWNEFEMRDDDIVISTWSKTGTNWTQQIVGQLVFGGAPGLYTGAEYSPWIDFRLNPGKPFADAQTHRRFLKSHLPIDTLPYSRTAKYIYIGRDGRDVYWSWHNHYANFAPGILEAIGSLYPDEPPIPYPNPDMRVAFNEWLDRDAYPNWPFWSHVQGWFDARDLPNLHLMHFANLKADPEGEIRKVAAFLDIEVADDAWPVILHHCSFDYMRSLAMEKDDPILTGGAATFFNKGTNGRWRDVLTAEDLARYDAAVKQNLSQEAARWLETGKLPA
jgi:aryl sulfotransferase